MGKFQGYHPADAIREVFRVRPYTVEVENPAPVDGTIGLDVGLKDFAVDSDGVHDVEPQIFEEVDEQTPQGTKAAVPQKARFQEF